MTNPITIPVPVSNYANGKPDVDPIQLGLIDRLVDFGLNERLENGDLAYFVRVETFPAPLGGRLAHVSYSSNGPKMQLVAMVITFDSSGLVLAAPGTLATELSNIVQGYGETLGEVVTFDSEEEHARLHAEREEQAGA